MVVEVVEKVEAVEAVEVEEVVKVVHVAQLVQLVLIISSVASLTIMSRYANIFVSIDCENNQFLKKLDAYSGVNSACKEGIIIGFRQPRTIETYKESRFLSSTYTRHKTLSKP